MGLILLEASARYAISAVLPVLDRPLIVSLAQLANSSTMADAGLSVLLFLYRK